MERSEKRLSWQIIKHTLLGLFVLLLMAGGYAYYRIMIRPIIPEAVSKDLNKYIATVFIICVAFVVQKVIVSALTWYGENIAAKTKSKFDDKVVPLLHKIFKVIVWIIALIVILPFYGVNISALIAALGVSSLAIALAAQDTIANIISGFMIMIDAPFQVGDRIKLPSGEIVTVLDISLRRSKFLSEDKTSVVMVPNLDLSKSKVINYTYAEEVSRSRR